MAAPPSAPPTTPVDHLGVIQLWTAVVAFERRLAAELVPFGLTIPGFRLIGEVMHEPDGLRQGELARRLGVRPPTVSAAVARLEQDGLVIRVADPDDPRARRVCLNPEASLLKGVDLLGRLDSLLFDGLSDAERAQVLSSLALIHERLAPETAP